MNQTPQQNAKNCKNYSKYFYILFHNKMITDGDHLSLEDVQCEPIFRFDRMGLANKGKYHTFVIVDPDAPVGFWIHQCLYNIPEDRINYGKTLLPYFPPTPPSGTGEHRYFCILYEQKDMITKDVEVNGRGFARYADFTKLLGCSMLPKASKFFICEFEG